MKNDDNKPFLRLKDLDNITSEKVDVEVIMREVLGYNNYFLGRRFVFKNISKKAIKLISEARQIDPTKCKVNNYCEINCPKSIDSIPYMAMLELRNAFAINTKNNLSEVIALIVAIVCYKNNYKELDYNSNSASFIDFKNKVINSNVWDMLGIYNWAVNAEKESSKTWAERFASVHVEDEDFEKVGSKSLAQFNVIKTIKTLCKDFNVNEKGAWQIPYALVQTNNYEIATSNYVKAELTKLKEIRLKEKRNGLAH